MKIANKSKKNKKKDQEEVVVRVLEEEVKANQVKMIMEVK